MISVNHVMVVENKSLRKVTVERKKVTDLEKKKVMVKAMEMVKKIVQIVKEQEDKMEKIHLVNLHMGLMEKIQRMKRKLLIHGQWIKFLITLRTTRVNI